MKPVSAGRLMLMAAIAAPPAVLLSHPLPAQSNQAATSPSSQSQSTSQAKPKAKKPEEPIDPDATAGVRGPGATHTVRVLLKGKPAEGAHVVVKNINGTVAASCYTSDTGECQIEVGADSYTFGATKNGRAGTVSIAVNDSTGPIVIKLTKVRAETSAPKPPTP